MSVLLSDGPDVKFGPLSNEVEEADFRGVFVPDPDLEGVLPISQATYPTNSVYQVRAMMIEAATDKVSRMGNRSVVGEAIICCDGDCFRTFVILVIRPSCKLANLQREMLRVVVDDG